MSKVLNMDHLSKNKLHLTKIMIEQAFLTKDHYKRPKSISCHVKARSHVFTSHGRLLRQTTCNRLAPMCASVCNGESIETWA